MASGGRGVSQVIQRYEMAKETADLDLSNCDLLRVPDPTYFILKEYTIRTCDLSQNQFKKFPAKLGEKFSDLTAVNVSHNTLSQLPDMTNFLKLRSLNLSYNSFTEFPPQLLDVATLQAIDLSFNQLSEVDFDSMLTKLPRLRQINVSDNPINRKCLMDAFKKKPTFSIVFQRSLDRADTISNDT